MKKNDFVLPIILILIAFFLPCAVYGYNRHKENDLEGGNPNHLPKVGDTLYYYNAADTLIGTYKCAEKDCNTAETTIDDTTFNYYEGTKTNLGIIGDNTYVFIQDGLTINLYNLATQMSIAKVQMIKNYGTDIEGNHIIVKNEFGKYGLFDYSKIMYTIHADYDWMGIANNPKDGVLPIDRIAVYKGKTYYIIDSAGKALSVQNGDAIYDYDENFIYYINRGGSYYLRNYDGDIVIDYAILQVHRYTKANVIYTLEGNLLVYDKLYENLIAEVVPGDSDYDLVLNGESELDIFASNGELLMKVNLDGGNISTPEAGTEETPEETE